MQFINPTNSYEINEQQIPIYFEFYFVTEIYEVISTSSCMEVTVMAKDKGLAPATHYEPQPSCGGTAPVFHIYSTR